MQTKSGFLAAVAAAAFVLALPGASARAASAADIAARLKTFLTSQGADIDWSGVSGDASSMTLKNVTVGVADEPKRAPIGDVTLSNVTESGGGYVIGTMSLPHYAVAEAGHEVDVDGVSVSGLKLPPPSDDSAMAGVMMYDKAEMQDLKVRQNGKDVFTLTDLHVDITPPKGSAPLTFEGGAKGFSADLTNISDPKSRAVVNTLGYQTINGHLDIAGSWSPKDGKLSLAKYTLAVDNAGTLGITFEMSGYTPQFLKQVHELQKQIANAPQNKKAAEGMAMLGLMQQLTFDKASITFEDASLTGKVLDLVAHQEQMRRQDIVNQAKAVIPFALAKLNNPKFAAEVTDAVSKFLDNPQSLTVIADPADPVPLAMLMAGAMTSPQQLPQQLGVKIVANKK